MSPCGQRGAVVGGGQDRDVPSSRVLRALLWRRELLGLDSRGGGAIEAPRELPGRTSRDVLARFSRELLGRAVSRELLGRAVSRELPGRVSRETLGRASRDMLARFSRLLPGRELEADVEGLRPSFLSCKFLAASR